MGFWISILHLYLLYAWGNFYLGHVVTLTTVLKPQLSRQVTALTNSWPHPRIPLSVVNGHGRYNNTVSPPEISRRRRCLRYKDNNFMSHRTPPCLSSYPKIL